ncbi:hypothetical protein [Radiobacillus sp. PE A8.2]|uniref:hypothetical protein n=1 Tax=Radiobacillus sp. PE A8.2 TaxID=3380349 RepID=UPI00388DEF1F
MEKQILELLTDFKHELTGMRKEFKEELTGIRTEFREELTGIRTEFKEELSEMRKDQNSLRVEMRNGFAQVNDKLDILTKQMSNVVIETYVAGAASKKELKSLSSRVNKLEDEVFK